MELNELELLELIKNCTNKIVLKVFTTGMICPYCIKYEPVFNAVAAKHPDVLFRSLDLHKLPKGGSQFKRLYMMLKDKEKADVPATLIFVDGKMQARKWGAMSEEQLQGFIEAGKSEDPKPNYKAEIVNLFAQKGEIVHICQKHQKQIDAFGAKLMEVDKRILELEEILGAPNGN